MTLYHAGAQIERVHLDFMGPLPKTKRSNAYVLMMVDQFTKWTECIPFPSQTVEITAQAAINELFHTVWLSLSDFHISGPKL